MGLKDFKLSSKTGFFFPLASLRPPFVPPFQGDRPTGAPKISLKLVLKHSKLIYFRSGSKQLSLFHGNTRKNFPGLEYKGCKVHFPK